MSKKTPVQDHYRTLQVDPKAGPEVIDASYRALMRVHHPDSRATKGETAKRLNEAHATLSDPHLRAEYDAARGQIDGKMVGNFRVIERLAEGGCGKTYKSEHVLTGMPVCIKHCSKISPEDEAIMIGEAQAMWDLRHYGIPAIRDIVRLDDGSLAIVMSFIEGRTLEQLVEAEGPLEPERVAWIAERLLNVLKYCHFHGIVHGDVKPQNVIIDPDPKKHLVTLVDFGLSAIKPTATTAAKGYTDIFAPPEQEKGKPLIPQIDFYSLGMTMIYALAGGDLDLTRAKKIPADTPPEMTALIKRLVRRETLQRPDWTKEDVQATLIEAREKDFGRRRSSGTR